MIKLKRLPHGEGLPLPSRATPYAAGIDLSTAEEFVLWPGDALLVPTGFAIAIPEGFEGQVRPRSGLALKKGLTVLNAPGTIDSDYRGEVMVMLINHGGDPARIKRGDRIAQLVIARHSTAEVVEVEDLGETVRGDAGFGSTGV